MIRRLLFLLGLLPCTSGAWAQGTRVDGVAQVNIQGVVRVIPNAAITVCTAAATGIPCSPTTAFYSAFAISQPMIQPGFTANVNGNFGFYIASGTYKYSIGGSAPAPGDALYAFTPGVSAGANVAQTGTITADLVNGICIVDGVKNATLAAAVTCAGSSGVIEIPMFAVPALTGNVTIPVGVTLRFDGPSGITTTGFTLTINGPIVAPDNQIFFGTGTIVLGSVTIAPNILAGWFPGADCGAKINAAAAAAGSSAFIVINKNCGTTISTALRIPVATKLQFLTGTWTWNVGDTIANQQITIMGDGWATTFFRINFQGDVFTVKGNTFTLKDISFQAAVARTSGAIVDIQANGGIVKDLYITDPYRAFTANTCGLGVWSFDNIRVQSAGGNWDSFLNAGFCGGTDLINSFNFNNINGNIKPAGTISAPFILLDSGVDTFQFSNSDFGSSGSTTNTQPIVTLQKTGASNAPRDVHFVNVTTECGTACDALNVVNALAFSWVNGDLTSSRRGCVIRGGVGTHITHAQIVNNQNDGCTLSGGTDTTFIGNVFADNSQSSGGGFSHLTVQAGVSDWVAAFNEFGNSFKGSVPKSQFAINVQAGASDNYRIIGNRADSSFLTDARLYFDGGTGVNKNISGNMPKGLPTCSVTIAGSSGTCTILAGSQDAQGQAQITVTAAGSTGTGTLTVTFSGMAFGITTTSSCLVSPIQTGAGSWNARASFFQNNVSTATAGFNWDNNAAGLTNGSTYNVNYYCGAR